MKMLKALICAVGVASASVAQASFINYAAKEINCKIVYYGAAALQENIQYIHARTNPEARGKIVTLKTQGGDVLFFDFLPLALGEIRGFRVRFHLYAAPGGSKVGPDARLVLKGTDGVIFVADSDPKRLPATLASWESLKTNLAALGYDWRKLPLVIQLANRDLPDALPVESLKQALGVTTQPTFEGVVSRGVGVFDSLKAAAKLILTELKRGG